MPRRLPKMDIQKFLKEANRVKNKSQALVNTGYTEQGLQQHLRTNGKKLVKHHFVERNGKVLSHDELSKVMPELGILILETNRQQNKSKASQSTGLNVSTAYQKGNKFNLKATFEFRLIDADENSEN